MSTKHQRGRRIGTTATRRAHAVEALECRRLLANAATPVADINTGSSFLAPHDFTPVGTRTYFVGKSYHGDGDELWITDGSAAGTRRVKDINPGKASSNPSRFLAVGNTLYFAADDGVHGIELWKSDGTEAGTTLVKDLRAGAASATPGGSPVAGTPPAMVDNNGTLFFVATDDAGTSLFKTDGTEAGTVRVTSTNYTFGNRAPLAAANGDVYFSAGSGSTVNGIYRTNAQTPATPVTLLKSFNLGSLKPANLTVLSGKVYFSADQDGSTRGDLYVTDGTAAGTKLVSLIGSGSYSSPLHLTRSGSLIYFLNYESVTSTTELWRTDGTAAGTFALSTSLNIDRVNNPFVAAGTSWVFFVARTSARGSELYRSDGTAATTGLVAEILPGSASGARAVIGAGGTFYVLGTKADGYDALYTTNGSGITQIFDLANEFIWAVGRLNTGNTNTPNLLFSRTNAAGLGELWRSDGTAATTRRVGTANAGNTASSMWDYYASIHDAPAFTRWGSGLVFAADDGVHGQEVWITYPQTGETRLLADVNAGAGSSYPNSFAVDPATNTLYFQAYTPATGTELFRVLPNGTVQIASNFATGSASSYPQQLRVVGSNLYFNAKSNDTWYLARYDLTGATGTSFTLGVDDSPIVNGATATLINGSVAIVSGAETANARQRLYRLNGSAAPTLLASDVSISRVGFGDRGSVNIGNVIYFVGYDTTASTELWRSDGTVAGTYRLRDITTTGDSDLRELTRLGNRLFFIAGVSDASPALWTTDGTTYGTIPYIPASGWSEVSSVLADDDVLYIIATDPAGTRGVWRLPMSGDLTPVLVAPQTATLKPTTLVDGGGSVPFVVALDDTQEPRQYALYRIPRDDGSSGLAFVNDLWSYDPLDVTLASTWGLGHGAFLAVGDELYFPAFQPDVGVEPFRIPLEATDVTPPAVTAITIDRNAPRFTIRATFSEAIVPGSLTAADLLLTFADGSPAVPASQIAVSYDAESRTASFTFPALPNTMPPTGWLRATIATGGVTDAAGNASLAVTPLPFTALPGDTDADGDVDFADLLTLAKNYNATGRTLGQGNVNYSADGKVDFADLLILAKAYNTKLGPAPAAAAAAAAIAPTRKRSTGLADVIG